jgi:hypothetical protein
MTFVSILRELWRRRLLLAVGLALGVTVGTLMAYAVTLGLPPKFENRQYEVGVASASVLVDSPSSQVADLGGGDGQTTADVESLSARARLLANLMATSPVKDRLAALAGIPPDRLIARAPTAVGVAGDETPIGTGATVSESDPQANILRINVNETLPILTADSQAPTPEAAARISSAAVRELRTYLKTVASGDRVPAERELVIKRLGPARYATVRKGPRRLFAVMGFLFVLGAWCVAVIVCAGLARAWREAAEAEFFEDAIRPPPSGPSGPASWLPSTFPLPPPTPQPGDPALRVERSELPERAPATDVV